MGFRCFSGFFQKSLYIDWFSSLRVFSLFKENPLISYIGTWVERKIVYIVDTMLGQSCTRDREFLFRWRLSVLLIPLFSPVSLHPRISHLLSFQLIGPPQCLCCSVGATFFNLSFVRVLILVENDLTVFSVLQRTMHNHYCFPILLEVHALHAEKPPEHQGYIFS